MINRSEIVVMQVRHSVLKSGRGRGSLPIFEFSFFHLPVECVSLFAGDIKCGVGRRNMIYIVFIEKIFNYHERKRVSIGERGPESFTIKMKQHFDLHRKAA